MKNNDATNAVDRRLFLGASASALLGLPTAAIAQQAPMDESSTVGQADAAAKPLTQVLAEFIAGFDLKTVPPPVIASARVAFIDTLGVALAGSREEVSDLICAMVKEEGSAPAASIVGQSLRASPQLAALANGVAAHAMDYDFTYISGQSIAPVIPAILPVAESTGATPAECVAAFIVGAEVAGRIVRANFKASAVGGWHTTGIVGAVAAAASCARLLKLPADKIPDAIGIATSMASGIAVNYGTMTKPLHSGHAARDGVMAALLAARGFTAHVAAFEGTAGYFETFGRDLGVTVEPFKDLGRRYDLVSTGYSLKAYPSGGRGHTAIEAALELRDALQPRLSEIVSIECFLNRPSANRIGTTYPDTVEAAKFSAAYLIPYALIHGAPRIPAFTEHALHDERVKALAKTVSASADPALPEGTDNPARLKITLKDGKVFEARRDYATGSRRAPMSQAQIEEKFLDCAAQAVKEDVARKILAALNALPDRPSFDDVWPLLRRS